MSKKKPHKNKLPDHCTMKLYLHNFLQDNHKGKTYYPLKIVNPQTQDVTVEYNQDMIQNFVKRIDFQALKAACDDLHVELNIPEDIEHLDEQQCSHLHHILFEIEVVAGELHSPSGRVFPIMSGIPDMCPHIEPIQHQAEEDMNE